MQHIYSFLNDRQIFIPLTALIAGLILNAITDIASANALNEKQRIRFTYNAKDQVTEITGPGERKIELQYNKRGQIYTLRTRDEK